MLLGRQPVPFIGQFRDGGLGPRSSVLGPEIQAGKLNGRVRAEIFSAWSRIRMNAETSFSVRAILAIASRKFRFCGSLADALARISCASPRRSWAARKSAVRRGSSGAIRQGPRRFLQPPLDFRPAALFLGEIQVLADEQSHEVQPGLGP